MHTPDDEGATALTHAALGGHVDTIKALLVMGADREEVKFNSEVGKAYRKISVSQGSFISSSKGSFKKKKEPKTLIPHGRTALLAAACAGNREAVVKLIMTSPVITANSIVPAGKLVWTALMGAAANGHADVVATLLELGADPNPPEIEGTVLEPWVSRFESRFGFCSCDLLLTCPSSYSSSSSSTSSTYPLLPVRLPCLAPFSPQPQPHLPPLFHLPQTALELANETGDDRVAFLLREAGADGWTPLMCAAARGDLDMAERLIAELIIRVRFLNDSICNNCGKEVDPKWQFCPHCSHSLAQQDEVNM